MCVLYAENGATFPVTAENKVRTKMMNKLNDRKAFVNTMGVIVPIWNINFCSLT